MGCLPVVQSNRGIAMAYGCKTTCDNCRPKYVFCPKCGHKNFLIFSNCKECGLGLTEEMKNQAVADWQEKAKTRVIKSCF